MSSHYRLHPHAWLALLLLVGALLGCGRLPQLRPTDAPDGDRASVLRIIDGDTIEVMRNGSRESVRYLGIDTPERGQPGYRAATEANRDLIDGRTVYLQRDRSDRDAFSRLLRYVILEDGTDVNAQLVADGWAQPVEYPPDTSRAVHYRALALEAAREERGFWRGTSDYDGAMSYGLVSREVDLRRGPGSSYAATRTLPEDTLLTLFGRSPNSRWLQVRLPDREGGWLPIDAVDANVPVNSIPVSELSEVEPPPEAAETATAPSFTARCPEGCVTQPDPTCFIKGNVNASGEKIYHVPGGSVYSRTQVRPDEGDRWFCTTAEAEANGFRASLR